MECWRKDIELSSVVVQCSSLVSVLEGCLGPCGKAVLLEKAGCIIITKDGMELLSHLEVCDPLVSVVVRGVLDHTRVLGDGCKSTLFLLHRLLSSLDTHVPQSSGTMQGVRRQRLIQIVQQIRCQVLGVVQRDVIKYGAQVYPLNSFEVFSHLLHTSAEDFFITKFSKLIARNLAKLFSSYISCVCSSSRELVKLIKDLAIKAHTAIVEIYHMPLMMSHVLNVFVVTRNFRYLHSGMKFNKVCCAWWSMNLEEEEEEGGLPRAIIETSLREMLVGGILIKRNSVERSLAHLSSLGTELVFSSLHFPDWAVSLCAKYGMSLLDSVDTDELDFLLERFGVLPIMEERDVRPGVVRSIDKIEPLNLGTCRFVQLSGLGVHQILLCGPTQAQCRQFSGCFHQFFRYLSSWVADCVDFSQSSDIYTCNAAAAAGCRDSFSPPFSPDELPQCELSPVLSEAQSSAPPSPTTVAMFFTVPQGGYGELLAKYLVSENISVDIKNSIMKSVVLDVFNELPSLLYKKSQFSPKSYVEFQTKLFNNFTELRHNNQVMLSHMLKDNRFRGYQNPFLLFKLLNCVLHLAEYLLRIECIVPAKQRISQRTRHCSSDSESE